ncbi:MAG: site-2 protease family protein [Prochlorothrix sp.]
MAIVFWSLVPTPQRAGIDPAHLGNARVTTAVSPEVTDPPASSSTETLADPTPDEQLYRPGLALSLLLMTLVTTTFIGMIFAGVTPEELGTVSENPQFLLEGLPYSLALMGVLGFHETGHFLAARHYQVRTTLPYFIPVPFFLGTFGAFIQMRSPVPNRKALFDVSIAGPIAGLVVTLPCLWWGLHQSLVIDRVETSSLLNFESLDPWRSLLLAVMSRIALGDSLAPDSALQLHPVAVAGYLGLIVTALNLMPVGQLDGGHIIHAMFGQRTGAIVGQVTRLLMLLLSLVQPDLLLWALLLLFMPVVDEPALNDVSELNDTRDLLGFVVLVLLLLIIMPVPGSLVDLLT